MDGLVIIIGALALTFIMYLGQKDRRRRDELHDNYRNMKRDRVKRQQ